MRSFDVLGYGVLVILVAILSWQVYSLKEEVAGSASAGDGSQGLFELETGSAVVHSVIGRSIDVSGLGLAKGQNVDVSDVDADPPSGYYLLILYTLKDCYRCYAEIPFWSTLQDMFAPEVKVYGIVEGSPARVFEHFNESRSVGIPILHDEGGAVFEQAGLLRSGITPVKVLTDKEGNIIHAGRTTYDDINAQAEYVGAIASIIFARRALKDGVGSVVENVQF